MTTCIDFGDALLYRVWSVYKFCTCCVRDSSRNLQIRGIPFRCARQRLFLFFSAFTESTGISGGNSPLMIKNISCQLNGISNTLFHIVYAVKMFSFSFIRYQWMLFTFGCRVEGTAANNNNDINAIRLPRKNVTP